LAIYNRWGELVFFTDKVNECWDGSFRGQPAPIGVYAYKVRASTDDQIIRESGNISLVR
jgi:gliding motility-associated-like protein